MAWTSVVIECVMSGARVQFAAACCWPCTPAIPLQAAGSAALFNAAYLDGDARMDDWAVGCASDSSYDSDEGSSSDPVRVVGCRRQAARAGSVTVTGGTGAAGR